MFYLHLNLKKNGFERFNLNDGNVIWQLKLINQKTIYEFDQTCKKSKNLSLVKLLGSELSVIKFFIVTAAIGSDNHPIALEMRYFRDNWILEKTWLKDFVKWYYHIGAKVAKPFLLFYIMSWIKHFNLGNADLIHQLD